MRPPCISTISLAMARPSPVPPLARVFELSTWRNFSKIRSRSSGGMPGPVSLTLTAKWPLAALAVIRTSPASVNLIALPTARCGATTRLDPSDPEIWDKYARAALDAGRTGEAKAAFQQATLKAQESNNPSRRYWATLGSGRRGGGARRSPCRSRALWDGCGHRGAHLQGRPRKCRVAADLSVSQEKIGNVPSPPLAAQARLRTRASIPGR